MEQGLRTIDDAAELHSLAQKCRHLADAISDGPARDNLIGLAAEYEHRADVQYSGDVQPLFRWRARGWTAASYTAVVM